jgi:hypothetical protein
MTTMSDNEVRDAIAEGAEKLNQYLEIGLDKSKLLKTGGYNKHTNSKKINKLVSSEKKLSREKNSLILNYNEAAFDADLGTPS